ncbi:MAG: hypothetical protein HRT87_00700 [Legionellales bacterium]|nr:hypothetical protein [Legionellales bacterium]
MKIVFRGKHTSTELLESISSVLGLLTDKYNVDKFIDINLEVRLLDHEEHDVDLIDIKTFEPITVFEVYKSANDAKVMQDKSNLTLVIDNTKENE